MVDLPEPLSPCEAKDLALADLERDVVDSSGFVALGAEMSTCSERLAKIEDFEGGNAHDATSRVP